jgi:hypothetical protein
MASNPLEHVPAIYYLSNIFINQCTVEVLELSRHPIVFGVPLLFYFYSCHSIMFIYIVSLYRSRALLALVTCNRGLLFCRRLLAEAPTSACTAGVLDLNMIKKNGIGSLRLNVLIGLEPGSPDPLFRVLKRLLYHFDQVFSHGSPMTLN